MIPKNSSLSTNPISSTKTQKRKQNANRGMSVRATGTILSHASLTQNVLPRSLIRVLPYTNTIALTSGNSGATSASTQVFRLNSLFDPDLSGTGHQPYGFDQLSQWYNSYLVTNAKITITFTTLGSTSDLVCLWSFRASNTASATIGNVALENAMERPNVGAMLLSPSGNSRTVQISVNVQPWLVEGITRQQYVDSLSSYKATISANPSLSPTIELATGSPSGASAVTSTVIFHVLYTAEFLDANALGPS